MLDAWLAAFDKHAPALDRGGVHLGLDLALEPRDGPCLRANVAHVNAAGPVVKLELADASGTVIHVELTHERYRKLGLRRSDAVYAIPRELHLFPDGQVG